MGGWKGLIASLLLLPALFCLPDSIQGSSNPELSVGPRERRAVPLYVTQYNPGQHKLVQPYYRPQHSNGIASDKNGIVNQSESELYTGYSAGMWVIGGLFTLVSVIAPGVVSAFSSVEPSIKFIGLKFLNMINLQVLSHPGYDVIHHTTVAVAPTSMT